MAANPQTKPIDLGCESAKSWQLSSTSTIAIVIITRPISWYSFYRPTEGGRLSRPRHRSKGALPVPQAVYRSGRHDKHNRPRRDSKPGPLTPQSDALTTRPQRPAYRKSLWSLNLEVNRRLLIFFSNVIYIYEVTHVSLHRKANNFLLVACKTIFVQ